MRSKNGFQSGSTSEGNNLSCLSVVPAACVSDEGSVTQHSPSLQNLVSGRVEKHSPCFSSHENSVRGRVKLHSPSVQVPSLQADDCTSHRLDKVRDSISELNKHVREMPRTAAVTHPSLFAVRPL